MIICTCGVAWLGYACTEYEECVYWISMYIVSMTLCQGRERRRLLPLNQCFVVVGDVMCRLHTHMKHNYVYLLIFSLILTI